jgi:hypothetical protein
MSTIYQDALSKHDDLNRFITEKDIFMSTSFDDFILPDDGFREWITPQYLESFKQASAQAYNGKIIWKLTKLASLKSLCTPAGTTQCEDIIAALSKGHLQKASDFKDALVGGNLSIANDANYYFTGPWTNTFNKLAERHDNLREHYVQMGYDVALYFQKYHKESNFYATIKALKNAECSAELKAKLKPHIEVLDDLQEILEEQKEGKSHVWTIVLVVLVVVRLLLRLLKD